MHQAAGEKGEGSGHEQPVEDHGFHDAFVIPNAVAARRLHASHE